MIVIAIDLLMMVERKRRATSSIVVLCRVGLCSVLFFSKIRPSIAHPLRLSSRFVVEIGSVCFLFA